MAVISVIVPVYKVEAFLSRCVDSILSQSFMDFELILVDDGSPDNCGQICEDYARQDLRVHVIHQKNGGLSAARNTGIDWAMKNSDSQWLAFVDSDDWIDEQYLSTLHAIACKYGCLISACEYHITDGDNDPPVVAYSDQCLSANDYYCNDSFRATAIACAKLYHKSLFQSLRYPIGKLHEDEFTIYRLVYAAQKIAVTQAPLYLYYQNPEGITLSQWNPRRMHILEATEQQIAFAQATQNEPFLRKAVLQYIFCIHEQLGKAQKVFHKELRRKMRNALKLGDSCGVFPKNADNLWAYEEAYPVKLFWWLYFKSRTLLGRKEQNT